MKEEDVAINIYIYPKPLDASKIKQHHCDSKEYERIININDPVFKGHINLLNLNISEKDLLAPYIKESELFNFNKNHYE